MRFGGIIDSYEGFCMILIIFYAIISFGLFLYSYTQVDLSLTLSRVGFFQTVQKAFQYIGYYNRPFSTVLFVLLVLAFCALYVITLRAISRKRLNIKQLWMIIGAVGILLVLSYPAFSYDFFNYMFTAKTVLVYQKNPYTVIPLQFTGVEPWLSFMHWTHLPSAYTPFWILLTLPSYFFGFGFFLLIMWNIKVLVALAFFLTAYYIGKILEIVEPKHKALGIAIFALNPLIIIETLVSGHNDIVMMALGLGAIYLFLKRNYLLSYLLLALSVASKLMTLVLYPVAFLGWNRKLALAAMLVGFVAVLTQREVLGWYWVWIVPFVALLPSVMELVWLSLGVSVGLLLRYAPFLFYGHWDAPVPTIKEWVTWIPIILSIFVVLGMKMGRKNRILA
jgi:hypothetical protein